MRASAQGVLPGKTMPAVDGPGDYPAVLVTRPLVILRGSAIKIILLLSLSIAGYAGIAVALSGAGQPLSETESRISPFAAPPPSLKTPVGAIARGALSGGPQNPNKSTAMPVPGSTHDDNNDVTAKLSEYVFLHNTRNERIPLQVAARVNVCPE